MINSLENSKKLVSEQVNSEQQVSSPELTVHLFTIFILVAVP